MSSNYEFTRIDHLVVHVDEKYQNDKQIKEDFEDAGFCYNPEKGKKTNGFKASNIFVGKDYFELVNLQDEDGGGWRGEWVELFNSNSRGLVCLMIGVNDITELYQEFRSIGLSEPETISFKIFKLFNFEVPWKNAYLPFFEKSSFQIGFQEIKNEKSLTKMQKRMKPNSLNNGIDAINKIIIRDNFTSKDYALLKKVFKEKFIDETLYLNNQQIEFVNSTNNEVDVIMNCTNPEYCYKSLEIENIKIFNT